MSRLVRHRGHHIRPFALLVVLAIVFALLPTIHSSSTVGLVDVNNILTTLASLGLVTLGLGLTMIAGEFDLSVSSTYLLGSMLAVKTGAHSPFLGVLVAIGVALIIGFVQGALIAKLGMNSMAVTLGGFIALVGLVYVISNNQSIGYADQSVGTDLTNTIASVFSIQILVALGIFGVIGALLMSTTIGRDLRALGSDRNAARVAGLRIPALIIGVFTASAVLCSLSGALQGYSLGYSAPTQTVSPLIFATTATLLGGVPLTGGRGNPLSIAAGVLSLGIVTEAIPVLHGANWVNSVVPAILLLIVTIADAPNALRWWRIRHARHETRLGLRGAQRPPSESTTVHHTAAGG